MIAGKSRRRDRHLGILFEILHKLPICVRGTADQSTRLAMAELQHDISCELIGRVFLSPENRDIVLVEHCVPNLVQIFVTKVHARCGPRSIVPCVYHVASQSLDCKINGEANRTEDLLESLKRPTLLQ